MGDENNNKINVEAAHQNNAVQKGRSNTYLNNANKQPTKAKFTQEGIFFALQLFA